MATKSMHLKIIVPERIVVDKKANKIIAEAPNGFFCLKPRHIDFIAALQPGILYSYEGGEEFFVAVDEGTLVKCGEEVLVSVVSAVMGNNLIQLEQQVRDNFLSKEKTEEAARVALRNMEADLIRGFIEMEKGFGS